MILNDLVAKAWPIREYMWTKKIEDTKGVIGGRQCNRRNNDLQNTTTKKIEQRDPHRGGQFFWWMEPEKHEKTTDLS